MSTTEKTMAYVLDQLSSLHYIRVRKMFGEYALYYNDVVIGLICDDQVFIKMTKQGKIFASDRFEEGYAYTGAKPSINITDNIDDAVFFSNLVEITYSSLPKPIKKKPRY